MATGKRDTGRKRPGARRRKRSGVPSGEKAGVAMFEVERRVYEEHLPELLDSVGKYVLILGGEIGGPFNAYEDALAAGYEKYGVRPFLVKQISAVEPIQYFSREIP